MLISPNGCLGCGGSKLYLVLALGSTPLANEYRLIEDNTKLEKYPLSVRFCPKCYLVQLENYIDPTDLYTEYLYFSSYSTTFLEHAKKMADDLLTRFKNIAHDINVLEIASNDGYLLKYFNMYENVTTLGIEPACNIAEVANSRGIRTLNCFFGSETQKYIMSHLAWQAHIIIGNNVLAHVPSINDFVATVRNCLSLNGVASFEFPYLGSMMHNKEWDTIYHEHVFYYSIIALKKLFERHNLEIFDVIYHPIHGGSIQIFVQHRGIRPVNSIVSLYEFNEMRHNLHKMEGYIAFGKQTWQTREKIMSCISNLVLANKTIAAYGAPAKGNTLLNFCGITNKDIKFAVDLSDYKQGKKLPGSNIPIYHPNKLLEEQPYVTLLLPWNFADEIINQQQEYVNRGGQFLIPIPEPHYV